MISSRPNYLPKAPPLNTLTMGIRTTVYNLGWDGREHTYSAPANITEAECLFNHILSD